jgi:hypothetical protein
MFVFQNNNFHTKNEIKTPYAKYKYTKTIKIKNTQEVILSSV